MNLPVEMHRQDSNRWNRLHFPGQILCVISLLQFQSPKLSQTPTEGVSDGAARHTLPPTARPSTASSGSYDLRNVKRRMNVGRITTVEK